MNLILVVVTTERSCKGLRVLLFHNTPYKSPRSTAHVLERDDFYSLSTWQGVPRTYSSPHTAVNRTMAEPRATEGERRRVGPEVGPTPAFRSCTPNGMHGPTCILRADLTPCPLRQAQSRAHAHAEARARAHAALAEATARHEEIAAATLSSAAMAAAQALTTVRAPAHLPNTFAKHLPSSLSNICQTRCQTSVSNIFAKHLPNTFARHLSNSVPNIYAKHLCQTPLTNTCQTRCQTSVANIFGKHLWQKPVPNIFGTNLCQPVTSFPPPTSEEDAAVRTQHSHDTGCHSQAVTHRLSRRRPRRSHRACSRCGRATTRRWTASARSSRGTPWSARPLLSAPRGPPAPSCRGTPWSARPLLSLRGVLKEIDMGDVRRPRHPVVRPPPLVRGVKRERYGIC
jgi:hypothetical protein